MNSAFQTFVKKLDSSWITGYFNFKMKSQKDLRE